MNTLFIQNQSLEYLQGYANGLKDSQPSEIIGRVKRIQEAVCNYFQVTLQDLKTKSRYSEIRYPRQVLCYLLMKHTSMGCPAIGRLLEQDHTTILYSKKVIETEMERYEYVKKDISVLVQRVELIKQVYK